MDVKNYNFIKNHEICRKFVGSTDLGINFKMQLSEEMF